jgi:hypothetical protein
MEMTVLTRAFRAPDRLARLALASAVALAGTLAADSASAGGVCEEFTLTRAQIGWLENDTWVRQDFGVEGRGMFALTADHDWPSRVTLFLRWEIDPGAFAGILPAAAATLLPVYLDAGHVGDGFGVSSGAAAQIDGISMGVGTRPVWFELPVFVPGSGCDQIRSATATLTIEQPWEVDPDSIPEVLCQTPGCDDLLQHPGDIAINPGHVDEVLPLQGQLPQIELRN